jgi:hypothetical protein
MQHFFGTFLGSLNFKVDPLLCGVKEGSDFNIFFSSMQHNTNTNCDNSLKPTASIGASEAHWDMSPFLAKARWLGHIHGYLRKLMRQRVGPLWKHEDPFLHILPSLAINYLNSVTQADIDSSVSPIALRKLNNWKS